MSPSSAAYARPERQAHDPQHMSAAQHAHGPHKNRADFTDADTISKAAGYSPTRDMSWQLADPMDLRQPLAACLFAAYNARQGRKDAVLVQL